MSYSNNVFDLPNKTPYTNPNSISNSYNNKYFTNQKSKIFKRNLNILNNANEYSNTYVPIYLFGDNTTNQYNQSITSVNTVPNFLNILEQQRNNTKLNKLY